jgi:hypothetical protein
MHKRMTYEFMCGLKTTNNDQTKSKGKFHPITVQEGTEKE